MEPIETELARVRQEILRSMDAGRSLSATSDPTGTEAGIASGLEDETECPHCALTGRPGMQYRLVKKRPADLPGQLTLAACRCPLGAPYRGKTAQQLLALDTYRVLFATPTWRHYTRARLTVGQFTTELLVPVARTLEHRRGFYLSGLPGRGKTWLAAALAHEYSHHYGRPVAGLVVGEWVEAIKDSFDGDRDTPSTKSIKSWPAQSDVLIVDDFGAEHTTPWVAATLFDLVHARELAYQTRQAVTIFTSNLSTGDLANHLGLQGKRIASRIEGMCDAISLTGRDRRQITTMAAPS